jgi:hypothetical protein
MHGLEAFDREILLIPEPEALDRDVLLIPEPEPHDVQHVSVANLPRVAVIDRAPLTQSCRDS